jgi:hypothetical protein
MTELLVGEGREDEVVIPLRADTLEIVTHAADDVESRLPRKPFSVPLSERIDSATWEQLKELSAGIGDPMILRDAIDNDNV